MTETDQYDYTFFARVLPERVPITIMCPPLPITMPDVGKVIVLTHIDASQVICKIKFLEGSMGISSLRNFVESQVRALVDFAGYHMKAVFDVDVISMCWGSSHVHIFRNDMMELIQTRDKHADGPDYELLKAVTGEPLAISVLADFREAMLIRRGAGFFCYRAIESMIQSMRASQAVTITRNGKIYATRLLSSMTLESL
jgi:hypothetical protein